MKTHFNRHGFTIIETMLFLAVTGVLTLSILIGSTVAINRQRYRDSVESLKGLVQEQYGEVVNVVNMNPDNPSCLLSDGLSFNDGSKTRRGASECLTMGRFILASEEGISAYSVIGISNQEVGNDDLEAIRRYSLGLHDESLEETAVSWGSTISKVLVETEDSDSDSIGVPSSILMVRSPLSGTIMTFTVAGDQSNNLDAMVSADNMKRTDLCVDSQGVVAFGSQRAVRINAGASGQSAVEVPMESDNVCG